MNYGEWRIVIKRRKGKSKTSSKSNSPPRISIVGIIGAALVIVAIVGALFWRSLFAFWKYEGNVPTIIDGGNYILPLSTLLTQANSLPDIWYSDIYILLGIYLPFMVAGALGLIGSLAGHRTIMGIAGFVGMCAVPLAIFTITRLVGSYGFLPAGMEWMGLFAYNQVLSTGTYTMALWVGFYLCAAGSYLIFFGQPSSK